MNDGVIEIIMGSARKIEAGKYWFHGYIIINLSLHEYFTGEPMWEIQDGDGNTIEGLTCTNTLREAKIEAYKHYRNSL